MPGWNAVKKEILLSRQAAQTLAELAFDASAGVLRAFYVELGGKDGGANIREELIQANDCYVVKSKRESKEETAAACIVAQL